MSRLILFLFFWLTSFLECFSCTFCKTIEQQDTTLDITYCPRCVNKCHGYWHFFINFTKNKNKHVAESYLSQYTPFTSINEIIYPRQFEPYPESIFIEFINALWEKLKDKEYYFKNPDLETLFFGLLDQESSLVNTQNYKELSYFYNSLKFLCIALYYECKQEFQQKYTKQMHKLLTKLDEIIVFAREIKKTS